MAGLSCVAVTFSLLAVGFVVPYGLLHFIESRSEDYARRSVELQSITSQQTELLQEVLALQEELTATHAQVDALLSPGDESATPAPLSPEESLAELHHLSSILEEEVESLKQETTKKFAALEDEISKKRFRFLVKWHGDEGVKTSKKMASELEALSFFDQVGDFAKKLLMYDGTQWVPLREYGGEKWLAFIRNSDDFQDGDGKPEKKPQAKAQENEHD